MAENQVAEHGGLSGASVSSRSSRTDRLVAVPDPLARRRQSEDGPEVVRVAGEDVAVERVGVHQPGFGQQVLSRLQQQIDALEAEARGLS